MIITVVILNYTVADGVPACLLKSCKKELSKPPHILWRSSLDKGLIPADLLLLFISPVHWGGAEVCPRISNLLPDGQHVFHALRSTLTQLISYWDTILGELEDGNGVDIIYTDFDKVETGVLLHKLKDCGISRRVGSWIAAYLDPSTRQQAFVVDGRVSSLTPVISGVQQGTVLGLILFLIHIRDIDDGLSSITTTSSFDDDTRVQRGIHSHDDCSTLQADFGVIYNKAKNVNMHFNGDKFEWLRIRPNQSISQDHDYLGPDGEIIEVKDNLKDLGVYLSSDLSFKLQVEKVVTSASKLAGWGLRTFRRRSLVTMRMIWKSLVQPKLD